MFQGNEYDCRIATDGEPVGFDTIGGWCGFGVPVAVRPVDSRGPMYKIVRHYLNRPNAPRVLRTGLTLQEATAWESSFEANSNTCKSKSRKAVTKKNGPWYDKAEPDHYRIVETIEVDSDFDLPVVIGTLIDIPVAFNPKDPWEDELTQEVIVPPELIALSKGESYLAPSEGEIMVLVGLYEEI